MNDVRRIECDECDVGWDIPDRESLTAVAAAFGAHLRDVHGLEEPALTAERMALAIGASIQTGEPLAVPIEDRTFECPACSFVVVSETIFDIPDAFAAVGAHLIEVHGDRELGEATVRMGEHLRNQLR